GDRQRAGTQHGGGGGVGSHCSQLDALRVAGDRLVVETGRGSSRAVQAAVQFPRLIGERLHVLPMQFVDVGRECAEVPGGDVHGSPFDFLGVQPTVTVPVMNGWNEQMYVKVPAVRNATAADLPGSIAPASNAPAEVAEWGC